MKNNLLFLILFFAIACGSPNQDKSVSGRENGYRMSDRQLADSLKRYDSLVNVFKVRNNPLARYYSARALQMTSVNGRSDHRLRALQMAGLAYSYTMRDTAFLYYHQAHELAKKSVIREAIPEILYSLGVLYSFAGNDRDAIMILDSCIRLAQTINQFKIVADGYNCQGNVYWDAHDLIRSHKMYQLSLEVALKNKLELQTAVALANLARFDTIAHKALARLRQSLLHATQAPGAEEETALIFNNIAFHSTDPDSVLHYSQLAIRMARDNLLPEVEMGAYNNMAYAYLDKKNPALAIQCLKEKAIPLALQAANLSWQASLYDTYADVLLANGDLRTALEYQKEAYRIGKAAELANAASQVRLLSVILEVKEKEELIMARDAEISRRNDSIRNGFVLLVALVFAIIGLILFYTRRSIKGRLKYQLLQNESARKLIRLEEQAKTRLAAEIHNIAGNILVGLAGHSDEPGSDDDHEKRTVLLHIENLSERLRKLSHRIALVQDMQADLFQMITDLANDTAAFSGKQVRVMLPPKEPNLSSEQRIHVLRIIQELLFNGIRHAEKGGIELSIDSREGRLFLFYEDKGPGFYLDENKDKGLGIHNIFERSKLLNGTATLHSSPTEGTSWTINVPLKLQKDHTHRSTYL